MSVSITIDERYVQGSRYVRDGSGNLGVYATNGVAVTASNFELPSTIKHLHISPAGGYVFEWDKTAGKVKAYLAAAHTHDLLLKDADQTDGATTRVNAATNKLGANTSANITVTGQAAGASAHGGVLGVAAASLAEVGNTVDLSSITFRFRVEGR